MREYVELDAELYWCGPVAGGTQASSLKSRMPPIVAPDPPAVPVTAQVVL